MIAAGERVGIAVSGGADSICLLHALVELGFAHCVWHVNHKLRGAESDGDAEFVATAATQLGLPCEVRDAPVSDRGNLEQEARNLRLAFFREAIARGTVDRVALGHTRSDQAETVLFRFLRGAGTAGLSGIRPVTSDGLIRPLIDITREEARAWLIERGIAWRDDSTNQSRAFARNRIRLDLLPQLEREWNPGIAEMLAHTADWAQAEEEYWQEEIGRLAAEHLQASGDAILVPADALAGLPLAAARRLVRRAMEIAKGDLRAIDFNHVEAVLDLAVRPEGGRTQAPGLDVCRSMNWLRFAKSDDPGHPTEPSPGATGQGNWVRFGKSQGPAYRLPAPVPGTTVVPGTDIAISLDVLDKLETFGKEDSVYNDEMGWLDWNRVSGSLELRSWQPGDRLQRCHASGEEKMKDLFQQARIPLWERSQWPVLADERGIVWTRRFGPAARCAAGPETSTLLRVREVNPDGARRRL